MRPHRREARRGRVERHRGPAPLPARAGPRSGRRGHHLVVLVRRLRQRDPVHRRHAGVRRGRPAHVQHGPRGRRGRDHAPHQGDPDRGHLRLPGRGPDARGHRRAPRAGAGRGRLPVDRRRVRRAQARHLRAPGRLRLLRQQAAHHGRGRGGAHRRPRAGPRPRQPAQPGPLRRRRLAGPLAARLQLPPVRRPLRHRRRPARAAHRHARRPGPGRLVVPGPHGRDRRRDPDVRGPPAALVVRLRAAARPRPGARRDHRRPRRGGGVGQALPAVHPPPALLPGRPRPPARRVPGHGGDQRLHHRAAVLPRDDRGPG